MGGDLGRLAADNARMGGNGYATSAVRRVIGIARDLDAAADGARPFQSANFARRWPTRREVPVTFIPINPTKPCLVAGRHVLARCPAKSVSQRSQRNHEN